MLCAASSLASAPVIAEVPYLRAAQAITDSQGRTQVIVDFTNDASAAFPTKLPPASPVTNSFHRPQTLNLVADFERRYEFARTGLTSWVGHSVTAYLTESQIDAMRADILVKQISEVAPVGLSSQPPWGNSVSGPETRSWGWNAVGRQPGSGSTRRIYVIDSGVAEHYDLNLGDRVNVACGSGTDCSSESQYALVGCYAHATHVAGIIAAKLNNGATTAGVYADANIISVGILTKYFPPGNCGNTISNTYATSTDRVGYALDFVYRDTLQNGNGNVSIVNMSINPGGVGWEPSNGTWITQPNYNKMVSLATPATVYDPLTDTYQSYPGAFVAQSAGNNDAEVCGSGFASRAFTPYAPFAPGWFPPNYQASLDDGIMVVGALHHTGDTVNSGINGFPALPFSGTYPPDLSGNVPASNFGQCVDIWAPGNLIASTWGDHSSPNTVFGTQYSGNIPDGTSGWAFLSGTSMAAPHIAGIAAYLADTQFLTTPGAIEQAVRAISIQPKSSDNSHPSAFYDPTGNTYVRDRANLFIRVPQLP